MRKSNAIGLGAMLFAAAMPAFAGIHYKSIMKWESKHYPSREVQVEGWVSGAKGRVAFTNSINPNPITVNGTSLLTNDGGKTLYRVFPNEKTYIMWDLDPSLGSKSAMRNGMGLRIQYSEPKVERLLDEDGGTVAGVPVHHTRYRTSYTKESNLFGSRQTSAVVIQQDFWVTPKIDDSGMSVWLRTEPPRTGDADIDRLLTAEKYKVPGFPLKEIIVTTEGAQRSGGTETTQVTLEVTQLDTSAVLPDGILELPADYKETRMAPLEVPRN
jgi:hypothetical protein